MKCPSCGSFGKWTSYGGGRHCRSERSRVRYRYCTCCGQLITTRETIIRVSARKRILKKKTRTFSALAMRGR